jgi:L-fucose isomerase-like protein
MKQLRETLPEVDFTEYLISSREEMEEVEKIDWKRKEIDGFIVYMVGSGWFRWLNIIEIGYPVILVDDLYGGTGGFLYVLSQAKRKRLPVVGVASSDFGDVIEAAKLFKVIKSLKGTKILYVSDGEITEKAEKIRENFGVQIVSMASDELNSYYNGINEEEAKPWADKWTNEALKVVEPSTDEIMKSAKMYLSLKKAMEDKDADAVTVNCLGLFYTGKSSAYPCLAYFQLNNEGLTGVCEADLDSTITLLLMRYLTGRPGYVSDPVIDTATNQIIYAHCVATNKVFGPEGLSNPYIIRSHSEDRKGASVQSLMPLGEIVTTIKINTAEKAMCIHQGKTVANIDDDRACRTKLAAKVDAEKILNNGKWDEWGWHRVTYYGDWKKQVMNLATLLGISVFEEDKDHIA